MDVTLFLLLFSFHLKSLVFYGVFHNINKVQIMTIFLPQILDKVLTGNPTSIIPGFPLTISLLYLSGLVEGD